jgi:hypothetical protein
MTYIVETVPVNDAAALQSLLNDLVGDGKTIDFVFTALAVIIVVAH